MIELIPAIDIIEGRCVRLTKGDYEQKTVYGEPLEMARHDMRHLRLINCRMACAKNEEGLLFDMVSQYT